MLNRLFIVIGLLAILALGAAFVLPRFISWGDYRGRMEAIASEVLGDEVRITGDIQFELLPQPRLRFDRVVVGPDGAPVMTVDTVEAEFSLLDFIRDRYNVTKLLLDKPVLDVTVDASGAFDAGIKIAEQVKTSNISVANANIVDGSVRLSDQRSNENFVFEHVGGDLKMEALRGPFAFQGSGRYGNTTYGVRVSTTKLDEQDSVQISASLRPEDEHYSLAVEGRLETGPTPKFTGDLTYRQPPPKPREGEAADVGRGDLVLVSKIEAGADRVLLSAYTISPDENRAGTRLTGAAELKLGAGRSFNAVVSGGVIALPPRDATAELTDPPYELVRLLSEIPLPAIPAVPGTIGLDIAELNLRAVSLRNLRMDVATDARSWSIEKFSALLPGGATLGLSGNLGVADGRPVFVGKASLDTQRLDALAALWRKPPDGNPLFNMPGSLSADVALSSDRLKLSGGTLELDGIDQGFDAELGFGLTRSLKFDAHFTSLGPGESAAIAALMPDMTSDASFGATFPKGEMNLTASKATVLGLDGTDLAIAGSWEGGVFEIDRLAAADLGGARFDLKLTAFGTLAKPEVSGSGTLAVDDENAPAFNSFLAAVGAPKAVGDYLRQSLPADLALRLDAPSGDGSQGLGVSGRLATADFSADARLTNGFITALSGPLAIAIDLRSGSPSLMTRQLGLGDVSLMPEDQPMHLVANLEGTPNNSIETRIAIDGGGDHAGFEGNVIVSDPNRMTGKGKVSVSLSDPTALAHSAGIDGLALPPLSGSAVLDFAGTEKLKLSGIDGMAGGQKVTGDLALTRAPTGSAVSGAVQLGDLDVASFLPVLLGPASTLNSSGGIWPDGPIDLGAGPHAVTGRVNVTAASIAAAGKPLLTGAAFDLDWDATSVRLRGIQGRLGTGMASAELAICCAGALPDKQLSGRLTLSGVALDDVLPPKLADGLSGDLVTASAQFAGTGDSMAAIVAAMTGDGSYGIKNLKVERLDPRAFDAVAGLENVVEMEPEALKALIVDKLDDGPFSSPAVSGGFTIAGGVMRSPNLAVEGEIAGLFGGVNLSLKSLKLDGSYLMSPKTVTVTDVGLDQASAQVTSVVKGTLSEPAQSFDVAAMVDAIMVKAYDAEVARLEKIKLEDEARQKAEAEERARVAAEQKAAEEKAAAEKAAEDKRLADEAALKKATEEAARKKAAEAAAQQPIDLGL